MISFVIPAFNEEKRLVNSLKELSEFLKSYPEKTEVLLVDDGSTDSTIKVSEGFKDEISNFKIISLEKNRGKGFAVKTGFENANGDIVLFTDADFSTPISETPKLLEKINEGADIAIGSRAINSAVIEKHQSQLRERLGRLANLLIQVLAVRGLKDTQCGFKAFKKTTTKSIFAEQKIYRYAFDIELLFLANRQGLKIAEVPIVWANSPDSKVNPLSDGFKILTDLLKIRIIHSRNSGTLLERLFFLIHRKKTFTKFAFVGLSGVVVDYSLFFLLTRFFHLSPLQANPINVEAAIIWTFTFNNLWTFAQRNRQRSIYKKLIVFQIVAFGGLMVSQMQILLYTHYLGIFDLLAKFLSIPIVAIFNYSVNSRWTFHPEKLSKKISFYYLLLILSLIAVYLFLVKEITGSFSLFIN